MLLSRRLVLITALTQVVVPAFAAADPYPPPANAASDLQRARKRASRSAKLLMVVFGGNWCADCRALHARLHESPVREYVAEHFEIVNVNIGEKNANLGIAKELGVSLKKGVPAAAFFTPDGKPVGFTNQGELEPARQYNARQVLTFLRSGAAGATVVSRSGAVRPPGADAGGIVIFSKAVSGQCPSSRQLSQVAH